MTLHVMKEWDIMIYDGERIMPLEGKGNIEEHEDTAQYAIPYCKGRVLDAACGSGWTSSLFAHDADEYVGMDISQETIDYCRENYPENQFIRGSILDIPASNSYFDAVVSLETFEHVDRGDCPKMITEVLRVLRDGGVYFFSTPDGEQFPYHPKTNDDKIGWHHWHYAEPELRVLLKDFKTVMIGKLNGNSSLLVVAYK